MTRSARTAGLLLLLTGMSLSAWSCSSDSNPGPQGLGAAGTIAGTFGTAGFTGATAGTGIPSGTAGTLGTAGRGPVAGLTPPPPLTGGVSGGAGRPAGAAGTIGAAGTPAPPVAGAMSAGTGAPPAGAAGMGTPLTPTQPGVNEPIIPEATGTCPTFMSGTQTIMDLSTEMVVGAPTSVKGPMLFTWHGTGGTGKGALRQLPQSVQRDIMQQGGIVIAASSNGQTRSGKNVALSVWFDGHDLEYADLLVACAVKNHNIDPRRIYVTGCSAGGLMSGTMAMSRSKYVAAVAPNSGGLTVPRQLADPMRAPAAMTMHGGRGDMVIVYFDDTSHTFQDALKPSGTFIVECNHNKGHCGAPTELHEAAWEFMKAHPFGTKPSPYAGGLPANFPSYCMTVK